MVKTPKKTGKKPENPSIPSETEEKFGVFDYINAILKTKKNLIRDSENPELAEHGYNAYLTNKALSFHIDTVLYANEMNQRGHLDKKLAFEYLINTTRSMQRQHTWPKKSSHAALEIIQEAYRVNPTRAQEIFKIIGDGGVEALKKKIIKGGTVK